MKDETGRKNERNEQINLFLYGRSFCMSADNWMSSREDICKVSPFHTSEKTNNQ